MNNDINLIDSYVADVDRRYETVTNNYFHVIPNDLAKQIAHHTCDFLDSRRSPNMPIVMPSEDDLREKILPNIEDFCEIAIEPVYRYLKKQNEIISYFVHADANGLNIDKDHLILELQDSTRYLDQDIYFNKASSTAVIDKIINHISFRNLNNDGYFRVRNELENYVREYVNNGVIAFKEQLTEAITNEKLKLKDDNYRFLDALYQQKEVNKTVEKTDGPLSPNGVFDNKEQKKVETKESLSTENIFENKAKENNTQGALDPKGVFDSLTEEQKNEMVFGKLNDDLENVFGGKTM